MRKIVLTTVLAGVALAGCADGGLLAPRSAPDEMAVVDGPRLTLPPTFELRPPKNAEDVAEEKRVNSKVKKMLTGNPEVPYSQTGTADDAWLLQQAGAANRDPNIRQKLHGDEAYDDRMADRSWWTKQKDKMFGTEEQHPAVQEAEQSE